MRSLVCRRDVFVLTVRASLAVFINNRGRCIRSVCGIQVFACHLCCLVRSEPPCRMGMVAADVAGSGRFGGVRRCDPRFGNRDSGSDGAVDRDRLIVGGLLVVVVLMGGRPGGPTDR